MTDKRNRLKLDARVSVESGPLLDRIVDALETAHGGAVPKGFAVETAVRLLAEVMGIPVPMGPKRNDHALENHECVTIRARVAEHLDRTITQYEADRYAASQKGGKMKAVNRAMGVTS